MRTLSQVYYQAFPGSAMCVQNFDDSRGPAFRITYRILLRSSSLWKPRHPLLKVVYYLCILFCNYPEGQHIHKFSFSYHVLIVLSTNLGWTLQATGSQATWLPGYMAPLSIQLVPCRLPTSQIYPSLQKYPSGVHLCQTNGVRCGYCTSQEGRSQIWCGNDPSAGSPRS